MYDKSALPHPVIESSEVLIHAFTRDSFSVVVRLPSRADSFLFDTVAAEPLLGVEGGIDSGVPAAELAGDGATAIGTVFVDCRAMLLHRRRGLHYTWLRTPKESAVRFNSFSEVVLFYFIRSQTCLCLMRNFFWCLFRHQIFRI